MTAGRERQLQHTGAEQSESRRDGVQGGGRGGGIAVQFQHLAPDIDSAGHYGLPEDIGSRG